jgi:hypothetical protein
MKHSTIETVLLDSLQKRITRIFPDQIRACLSELTDEQIWWRPNDNSNSVGNLVLHLAGSVRHYLCRGIGGFEYERNRPAEFSERGPIPRQELLAIFEETIRQSTRSFESLDTSRLLAGTEEPGYYGTLLEQLVGVGVHMATHTGQIIYATRLLKEGSLDELWIQTHRA